MKASIHKAEKELDFVSVLISLKKNFFLNASGDVFFQNSLTG